MGKTQSWDALGMGMSVGTGTTYATRAVGVRRKSSKPKKLLEKPLMNT